MKINESEIVYQPIIINLSSITIKQEGWRKCRKSANERQMLKESLKLQGEKKKERKEGREKNLRQR